MRGKKDGRKDSKIGERRMRETRKCEKKRQGNIRKRVTRKSCGKRRGNERKMKGEGET